MKIPIKLNQVIKEWKAGRGLTVSEQKQFVKYNIAGHGDLEKSKNTISRAKMEFEQSRRSSNPIPIKLPISIDRIVRPKHKCKTKVNVKAYDVKQYNRKCPKKR